MRTDCERWKLVLRWERIQFRWDVAKVPVVRMDGQSLRCFADEEALLDEVGGSAEWSGDGSKTHEVSRKKKVSEMSRTVVESQLTEEALIEIADHFATVVGSVGRLCPTCSGMEKVAMVSLGKEACVAGERCL